MSLFEAEETPVLILSAAAHISYESQSRPPCILKKAATYLKTPGLISLGGGLPSSEYFPISEMSIRVPVVPYFSEKQSLSGDPEMTKTITFGKYDAQAGLSDYDLSIALNYSQAMGSPQMMRWITEHTEIICNPPYADWQCCPTVGSTAALEQTIRMLCYRDRNDSVITEEYTFATALETCAPQGIKVFGARVDEQGLLPSSIDFILSSWDESIRGARKPHVLYTVPTGQNPTGATQGLQRRRDIYAVCQKHNIFIIEDEPYYFLQMDQYVDRHSLVETASSIDSFLGKLIPSFLSLDTDGRVLRMDSFSKVLVPGSRTGWVTASEQIIQRFIRHAEVANQGPSGISQIVLWKLLDETWGHEGYLRWLMDLRCNYTKRRNMLLAACEDYLPQAIASWVPPQAGMFLWIKLDHTKHPDYPRRAITDIEDELFHTAIENGVLFASGCWFRAEPHTTPNELFVRVTFASASGETMSTAIQRLSAAIRKSFRCEEPDTRI
ncbi:hypothetical protein FDECE_17310 [Fusarium decemcellulare]|nr:hypothetical protein FDECE_17310 [Fusarium decemcellulare]